MYPSRSETQPAFTLRPCGDFGWAGSEDPYVHDSYGDPVAQDGNWCEELADTCGLNTSKDKDLISPAGATEEGASFAMVVRRAAEVLDLQLPFLEVRAFAWDIPIGTPVTIS